MPGRIRTIKPELIEDEKVATLSDPAFRMFVALILLADDYGNLRADDRYLHGAIFWGSNRPIEVTRAAISELHNVKLLQVYYNHGQKYASLCGWSRHQKVAHPGKPRVPGPEHDSSIISQSGKTLGNPPRNSEILGKIPPDHDHDQRPTTTDPPTDLPHADLPVGGGAVAGKAEKSEGYIQIQDEDWGDEPSIPQLQLTLVEPPAPKRTKIAPGALEALYRLYPRKEGKKRGLEALGRLLRDATDPSAKLAEVERAVKSYARLCAREQRDPTKIKHFDTFMNNWTDYIDCDPSPLPASRPPVYNAPAATISDAERTEVMSMVQDLGRKLRGGLA